MIHHRFRAVYFCLSAAVLSGCTPSIYAWGGFEQGLYERYVNEQHPQADAILLETITEAERNHLKVPPGAYADYGYVLFKRGDRDGAVAYFEKEKQAFPESSALMSKLIERVKLNQTAMADKPATSSNEGAKP